MILHSLLNYYEALAKKNEISRLGWCVERVSFALNISLDGELLDVIPTTEDVTYGKNNKSTKKVPTIMTVPERVVRAGKVIKPNFLCDNSGYILGFDSKGDTKRALEYFNSTKEFYTKMLGESKHFAAIAICKFFDTWDSVNAEQHPKIVPFIDDILTANLVFMIDGSVYAHEIKEIAEVWDNNLGAETNQPKMRCLVTGKNASISRIHGKIKGVPNAQPAGANLIGFNDRAYESYGYDNMQGFNAPISEYVTFAYVTALNHLIADKEHRQLVADSVLVYWAENAEPKPKSIFAVATKPDADNEHILHGLMDHIAKGKLPDGIEPNKHFYILAVSPNAARISVRFYYEDTFGNIIKNLYEHYKRLDIVRPLNDNVEYLSVNMLLSETVNLNSKDKAATPLLGGEVMHSIFTGSHYPQALYQSVISRIRSVQDNKDKHIYKITRGKAAIIKAVLMKKGIKEYEEVLSVALNEETNCKPYVLGRLFSMLEGVQQTANPSINATIKDKYFNSACATPNVAFPTIMKLYEAHIKKIRSDKPGMAVNYEKSVQGLLSKIEMSESSLPFPSHLSLNDQGVFILGYYHQTQARYTKKEEE